MKDCYERNKDKECWREANCFPLCDKCPKVIKRLKNAKAKKRN